MTERRGDNSVRSIRLFYRLWERKGSQNRALGRIPWEIGLQES